MKKIILFALFLNLILISCNRETLKFFFDGVDDQAQKVSGDSVAVLTGQDVPDSDPKQPAGEKREMMYHPDFLEKSCSTCHNMGGTNQLAEPQPDLCYQCHDSFTDQYQVLHGPVAGGYCTACHHPPQSENKFMLRMPAEEVCLTCHEFSDVQMNGAHDGIEKGDCLSCHDPHGGETNQFLLD